MAKRNRSVNDFREFLFTTTRSSTPIPRISWIDLIDNFVPELDKLDTIVELFERTNRDEAEAHLLCGASLLLKDILSRMRRMLTLWEQENHTKHPRRTPKKKRRRSKP